MNEQIRELIKQSKMSLWEPPDPASLVNQVTHPGNYAIFSDQFLEKFAELIIKECANIARGADLEDVEGGDSAVLRAAGEQIEKHFGVEE